MNILLNNLRFPEGPAFDKAGNIWLVEKDAGNLILVKNQEHTRFHVDGAPNGITIQHETGLIWFCDSKQNSIRTFDIKTLKATTIVSSLHNEPLKMPNDLVFDSSGNLLFTCPGDRLDDGTGYICCLTPNGKLELVHEGMYYPNGLAFSPDQNTLYVAETGTHFIWKLTWNPNTRTISNAKKWINVGGPIGPDGIAVDTEGHIYVAVYGAARIKKIDQQGKIIEQFILTGKNPTNCALDPFNKRGLVITEADEGVLIHIPQKKDGLT